MLPQIPHVPTYWGLKDQHWAFISQLCILSPFSLGRTTQCQYYSTQYYSIQYYSTQYYSTQYYSTQYYCTQYYSTKSTKCSEGCKVSVSNGGQRGEPMHANSCRNNLGSPVCHQNIFLSASLFAANIPRVKGKKSCLVNAFVRALFFRIITINYDR